MCLNKKSYKKAQHQNTHQPNNRNRCFHDCPREECLFQIEFKKLFEHPKTRIVDVRTEHAARSDCQHQ